MIYIIRGNEEIFIREKLNELEKQNDAEIVKLNGSDKSFSVDEMLDYCNGSSLFAQKNVVFVKDPFFLIKKCDDKETKKIVEYVNHPLFETDLVLYTYEDKFSQRLSLFKEINKNAQLINCDSFDAKNFPTFAMQEINKSGININKDGAMYLTEICGNNATLLKQNLEILKLYPGSIDKKAVTSLCTIEESDDTYKFINAYLDKNASEAINTLIQLVKEIDSVLLVIAVLASQLRFMYQFAYFAKKGRNNNEIASILNCSPGRAYRTRSSINKISMKQIMEILDELSKIELQCKMDGNIDQMTLMELFILDHTKGGVYASH